ncbi:hypothetical protein B0H34DRAFT_714258 [Crassisporium funariophilum]|nr:hypothetical protein B0H34DRAFT_714258 [Crassisporium funariophilum]
MDPQRSSGSQQPWINSTIPAEVLCEIMLTTALICDVDTTHEQAHTNAALFEEKAALDMTPLLLSHVCAYWRALATSLPSLWTNISVMSTTSNQPLELWLARGRALPISISLRLGAHSLRMVKSITRALTILGPYAHRWKALSIHIGYHIVNSPIDDMLRMILKRSTLSALTTLDFEMCDAGHVYMCSVLCQASPRLDTIKVVTGLNSPSKTLPFLVKIPECFCVPILWKAQQLKHLYITAYFGETYDFLNVIAQFTFLETLSCCGSVIGDPTPPRLDPCPAVTLTHLRVLNIAVMCNTTLFDCLTLPNLRKFRLDASDHHNVRHAESIERMLARSACQLDAFTFRRLVKCAEELPAHFLGLPAFASLRALRIYSDVMVPLVVHLTVPRGPGAQHEGRGASHPNEFNRAVLLPNLTSLVLVGCITQDGALLEMARSRIRNSDCAQLRYVRIHAWCEDGDGHVRDVDGFREMGEGGVDCGFEVSGELFPKVFVEY